MTKNQPDGNKGRHLYLVDGSGFIFRAYHALPPLTRPSDGLPIGAVHGFCAMLWKLLRDADELAGVVVRVDGVLEQGQLVEQGTHAELLEQDGIPHAELGAFPNDTFRLLVPNILDEVVSRESFQRYVKAVIEDGSRVGTVYFLMSEENVRRKLINFARNVLAGDVFDYRNPNPYFEEP